MTKRQRCSCTLAFLFLFLAAVPLTAQDSVSAASVFAPAGSRVSVPIYVRDLIGTSLGRDLVTARQIRALSLRLVMSPASSVSDVSFQPGGTLTKSVSLYEHAASGVSSAAFLASYRTDLLFTSNAAAPGDRVGTLRFTLAGSLSEGAVVNIGFDPETTALSNQAGTVLETAFNRKLRLIAGSVTIGGTSTTTTLTSSMNPSENGQLVTFTATVTPDALVGVGGTVLFLDGDDLLATVPVHDGIASYATSALPVGTRSIRAVYEGSGTLQQSTSEPLHQVVNEVFLDPPQGLVATAVTPTRINLQWTAVEGAAAYEVLRRGVSGTWVPVAAPGGTTLGDTTVEEHRVYLYAVRAVSATGGKSDMSGVDVATTSVFPDAPLAGRVVKQLHLHFLRSMIASFRTIAGIAPYTYTDQTTPMIIRRSQIDEMREALGQARAAAGLPPVTYTDPSLTGATPVKAVHFEQLHEALK